MTVLHDDLLAQARFLLARDAVTDADVRRAASAAYYAVFHAITDEWSQLFRPSVRSAAVRMLDHGPAKNAATKMRNAGSILDTMQGRPHCPTVLRDIADAFVHLQERRHKADYDTGVPFQMGDAFEAIKRADRLLKDLAEARATCPGELQAFLLALHSKQR